ncbi:MAG TPA: response regulator [Planctomycetes bacterium]|nr:response regulator [Planctomycetota bacterium]
MAKRYVLIVEDNPDICALLGRLLAAYDTEAVVARTSAEAVEKMKTFPVHLALVDVILEGMSEDGTAIARRLREEGLRSPLYIMSCMKAEEMPADMDDIADGFLEKPFTLSAIKSVMQRHLGTAAPIGKGTALQDVLGLMTSVATEQEEIRRQQERLANFIMLLQKPEGAAAAQFETFKTTIARYESGLERIQRTLEDVQNLVKKQRDAERE